MRNWFYSNLVIFLDFISDKIQNIADKIEDLSDTIYYEKKVEMKQKTINKWKGN